MAWTVEYTTAVERALSRLDRQTARRIRDDMRDRVAVLDNPRDIGNALTGRWSGYWRYRVGDYRVICDIQDEALRVLVVTVGHRSQVYY